MKCCGLCHQGRRLCVVPEACHLAEPHGRIREFFIALRECRDGGHGWRYSARIAYGIAFKGLPF